MSEPAAIIPLEPGLVDFSEAARLCSLSKSHFYKLHSTGRLGPVPIELGTKCLRFSVADLRAWWVAGCPDRRTWLLMKQEPK